MVTITTIVLAGYNRFNSQILLTNLAYDIALVVREAQVKSLAVGAVPGGITFTDGFGVYFDKNTPNSFVYYYDVNGNGKYGGPKTENEGETCKENPECIEIVKLSSSYEISDVCATVDENTEYCFSSAGNEQINHATIYFVRPEPEARFLDDNELGNYQNIHITISSPVATRTIYVYASGQISIQ